MDSSDLGLYTIFFFQFSEIVLYNLFALVLSTYNTPECLQPYCDKNMTHQMIILHPVQICITQIDAPKFIYTRKPSYFDL